ncbi:MAG TPA: DUF3107 domain-containing protein [Actinomycetales bacterium]|nr:DUF3107 domain-containing protein [Actinomycetales bacterium]
MEITVGMHRVNRELTVETDLDLDAATKLIQDALSGNSLILDDTKGRRVVVPSSSVAYVELGSDTAHPVGFLR